MDGAGEGEAECPSCRTGLEAFRIVPIPTSRVGTPFSCVTGLDGLPSEAGRSEEGAATPLYRDTWGCASMGVGAGFLLYRADWMGASPEAAASVPAMPGWTLVDVSVAPAPL